MSPRPAPQPTRESVAAWLRGMPPVRRHALAALLADASTAALLAQIRREAAWEATRSQSRREVAEAFGVSERAIKRLVNEYGEEAESEL